MRLNTVNCPHCKITMHSRAGVPVGATVACPKCGQPFVAAALKPAFEVVEDAPPVEATAGVAHPVIKASVAVEVVGGADDSGKSGRVTSTQQPADAYGETLAPGDTPPRTGTARTAIIRAADAPSGATMAHVEPPIGSETLTQVDGGPAEPVLAAERAAQVQIPGYQIEAQLGHGGMGVVFRARQVRLNRSVAIKMILGGPYASPEARIRFLTEAEAIAKLHHPHIVQVYEFGQHEGYPYFTLEFLEGGTLEKLLGGVPLKSGRAVRVMEQLAHAVQHAHDRGIIHRDLKPSNILLDADETPKISDFGLAKQIEGGSGMTQSGSILGTPSYMAPEQARGEVHGVGSHSDVYALGAILYECLTGRPPFRGTSTMDTIKQVVNQEPVAPRRLVPSIPRDLETICLKCLQKNPAGRYASAGALAEDLKRFQAGDPIKARPIGHISRGVRWVKRHPSSAALMGVVGLAIVALLLGSGWYNLRLQAALATAESEKRRAEAQTEEAESQRQEADRQRKDAEAKTVQVAAGLQRRLDIVDDMLVNLDGRLAMKTGMNSVRMEFLNEFLKISRQLLAEQGNDPGVRQRAARVYRSIGDLCLEGNNVRGGEPMYAEAVKLQRGLVDQFPDRVEYQTEYAATCLNRATLLWLGRRYPQARESVTAAIAAADRLVNRSPGHIVYRLTAARYRFFLANILEDSRQPAEARASYEQALARQEELARQFPTRTDTHRDLAATLTGLGLLHEATNVAAARMHLERALTERATARDLVPTDRNLQARWQDAVTDLLHFYRRHRLHAELAALAEVLAGSDPDGSLANYNAACYLGYAAADAARVRPALADADRVKVINTYATRALALLQLAVEAGFTDRAHIATDPDLDPFRNRPDFRQFTKQLAARFPNKPATPAALVEALQKMYTGTEDDYTLLSAAARSVAERKRAVATRASFANFGGRILALAEKHPEAPASLDALVWVLRNAPKPSGPDSPVATLLKKVMGVLRRDHLARPDFVNACAVLATRQLPDGDQVLEAAVVRSNSPQEVRGIAAYALALSLLAQATRAEDTDATQTVALIARAEKQLEMVIRDFDAVPFGDSTLGKMARKRLTDLRTLSIGRVAPDIEGTDLDGKSMKLSDFRGKVVLLDFWANWCGFCRAMYPHERKLVARLKGKPFVLVGINCDESLAEGKRAVDRNKLNWASWFDGNVAGGRATHRWQIDSYPSLFLLDENGVIRRRWQGKPDEAELDLAVDQLLRQMNQPKK